VLVSSRGPCAKAIRLRTRAFARDAGALCVSPASRPVPKYVRMVEARMTRRTNQDRADVERVFNKYLESINAADVALASQVWLQSPEILVVTPFGRFKGWDSVRDDIYVNFAQKQLRQRNLHTSNVSIVVAGDAAWLVYDFAFTATWADGRPLTSNGWESHGYLKTVNGWRIAHLHYSVPAALQ
jgi:ketosteroid isomerase-like protein